MVERFKNQLTPDVVSTAETRIPRITTGDRLIGVLDKFVDSAQNTLDVEAVRKAKAEGAKAGVGTNFQTDPANTLYSRAFNKSGIETFLNKTKTTTDKELSALMLDARLSHNPAEYEKAAVKVIDGIMKDMPLEAIPNYQIYADSKVSEFSSRTQVNAANAVLETNKATFEAAKTNSLLQISNAAENGDLVALSREQESYIRALDNQGLIVEGGTGVLTPEQIFNAKDDMFRRTRENLVMGAFRRTPTNQKLKFIGEFKSTKFAETSGKASGVKASGLTAEEKRKMEDAMLGDLSNELTQEARKEAEETAADGQASDAAMLNFYENPADDASFKAAKQLNPTKAATIIAFRSDHLNGDNKEVVNDTFRKLHDGVLTNQWLEDQLGKGISGATYDNFRKKLITQKTDYPFASWPAWKDEGGYLDRLANDVPVKTNLFGRAMANDKNARIAARVRQEMFDTSAIEWRRFQNGELKDPPDILHLYNRTLKKIMSENEIETPGKRISSVPAKYKSNPSLLADDIEAGLVGMIQGQKWKDELGKINGD